MKRVQPPIKNFSLSQLLKGADYEAGLSKLAEGYGMASFRGAAVPHRRMLRDLNVGTATEGGNLANAAQVQQVADAVRPATVLEQIGAQRLEVSGVGSVSLPSFTGGTGGWLAEGDPVVSDSTTIDTVTCTPHCAAARLGLTRKVRVQVDGGIEGAVLREVSAAVRATLEAGFLAGSGSSNQPLGLINTPGIGSQSFAGAVPTYDELVGMVETLADADGELSNTHWILHPSDLADLLKTQQGTDGPEVVQFISGTHRICGLPVSTTRHLTEGKHLLLDPAAVVLAYFGTAQIVEDLYSNGKSTRGDAEMVVFNFADLGIMHPEHVVVGSA